MVEFYSGKFFDLKEDGLLRQGKIGTKRSLCVHLTTNLRMLPISSLNDANL